MIRLGTEMSMSGGHAVIRNINGVANTATIACPAPESGATGVRRLPFDLERGPGACADQLAGDQMAGKDIWHRGDFESARYGDAVDQSWDVRNADASLSRDSRAGRYALALKPTSAKDKVTIMPRTYLRVLEGSSYSVAGWIKADNPLELSVSVQSRPPGMGRFQALEEAEWKSAGSKLMAEGGWQYFRFDFQPARSDKGKVLPLRPRLQFSGTGGTAIRLDDFSVIERTVTGGSPGGDSPLRRPSVLDGG